MSFIQKQLGIACIKVLLSDQIKVNKIYIQLFGKRIYEVMILLIIGFFPKFPFVNQADKKR